MFKAVGIVSGKRVGSSAGKYSADLKVFSLAPLYLRILRFQVDELRVPACEECMCAARNPPYLASHRTFTDIVASVGNV